VAAVAGDRRKGAGRRVRTRLDPELRREQLLDAAETVFAGRDPRDVTFEQVADAAGVSRALVYNYFGDRFGLIAAMYVRWALELDRELTDAFLSADPPDARLRRVIRSHLDFAARHGDVVALVQSSDAPAHHIVDQAIVQRHDRLAEAWGPTPEEQLVARGVLALLERVSIDRLATDDLDDQAVEDLVFSIVWPGLAGRGASPFR
jgi:AcrR family transcriptional regulator